MRNHGAMKIWKSWTRLAGPLALVMIVGCDSGAAPDAKPKTAAADKKADAPAGAKKDAPVATPPAADPKAVEPKPVEPPVVAPPVVAPPPVEPPAVELPSDGGDTPAADDPSDVTPTPTDDPSQADPVEPGGEDDDEPPTAAVTTATAGSAEVNGVSLGTDAELLRLVLAHDVVNRQPVEPAVSFPEGHKVNLFVEARNESDAEIELTVTWERVSTGKRTPSTTVRIPTRKLHRTRAFKTLTKAGEYRCIILAADGRELAAIPFTIGG